MCFLNLFATTATAVLVLLLARVSATSGDASDSTSVTITTMDRVQIIGHVFSSFEDRPYHSFRGIRYAKPPTDQLRFKPPVPADAWNDFVDATKEGASCPQSSGINNNGNETMEIIGNEDCLFLNVYTPKVFTIIGATLPVLVYIHGGGFSVGSGGIRSLDPKKFMDLNIVLVTINYRLGPLGFLSTGDQSAHGNYGMLDQVLALRWVQQNIGHFGGDADRVTVMGNDAGGVSVTLLVVSPLTKGLFHAAIAQSGSVCSNWSLQKTKPLSWTRRISSRVNCTTESTREAIECLRRTPVERLIRAASELQVTPFYPTFLGPVVEVAGGGGGFLTEDPMKALKEGRIGNRVPYITGITKDGGHTFASLIAASFKTKGDEFFRKEFPIRHLPNMLDVDSTDLAKLNKISRLIQKEYFAHKDTSDKQSLNEGFAKTFDDAMFVVGAQETLTAMANSGMKTYAYSYTHGSESSPMDTMLNSANAFNRKSETSIAQSADDATMSDILYHLWTNFMETKTPTFKGIPIRDPSLKWIAYTAKNPAYMELSVNPTMKDGPLSNRTEFWTKTIHKHVSRYREDEL